MARLKPASRDGKSEVHLAPSALADRKAYRPYEP